MTKVYKIELQVTDPIDYYKGDGELLKNDIKFYPIIGEIDYIEIKKVEEIVKLRCIIDNDMKYKKGNIYNARLTNGYNEEECFLIDETGHFFSIHSDEDGLSYKNWFEIVEEE